MALPVIYRGEDKSILFNLTDANDDPLVINDLTGLIIELFLVNTPIGLFSVNALDGYNEIVVTDSAAGQVTIKLTQQQTRNAPLGTLKAEVKTRITPSGVWDSATAIEIAEIVEARTRNITTFS